MKNQIHVDKIYRNIKDGRDWCTLQKRKKVRLLKAFLGQYSVGQEDVAATALANFLAGRLNYFYQNENCQAIKFDVALPALLRIVKEELGEAKA